MSEDIGDVSWSSQLEEYFASTGEKAHCLSWIHKRAEELYARRRTWIDLPVIVISSITGFLSVGSSTMFGDTELASIGLGVASLVVSVLNTTGSYFAWAKRAEGHRISSIQYARLFRFLSIEMALPRDERMSPKDLLKMVKDQYDRLQEISPLIPPEVIKAFQKKFSGEQYKDIHKPEDANGLEKISVFVPPTSVPLLKIRSPPLRPVDLQTPTETPSAYAVRPPKRPSVIDTASTHHTHQRKQSVAEGNAPAPTEPTTSQPTGTGVHSGRPPSPVISSPEEVV